jgi:CheY-like chemotaxis protein/anti-sigma regulatory factor (Ser/Thr protein kinase)
MPTVLIVDDVAAQRQLAAGLIGRDPHWHTVFACNGKEALAQLAAEPVDLVLTDLLMPEMDGLELLRAVRAGFPRIPVILMTAAGSEDAAVRALQEGAASYVPKRALARRLKDTLHKVLTASSAEYAHAVLDKRLTAREFTFVLENDAALLLALPTYLKPHLSSAGLTDHLAYLRTNVALQEALTNALYHGNLEVGCELREQNTDDFFRLSIRRAEEPPFCNRRIHVHTRLSSETAQFCVRDEGPGFDPATLPDPTDTANLDRPHGRGVLLMRTFMDEVRYNDRGNEVTMTKRLLPPASHQVDSIAEAETIC